jgi:hypothetical protein
VLLIVVLGQMASSHVVWVVARQIWPRNEQVVALFLKSHKILQLNTLGTTSFLLILLKLRFGDGNFGL